LLFLERFKDVDYFEVKGVAEIENNEEKILDKIKSLSSYEKYKKRGKIAYPDLEFVVLCCTIKTPNDELTDIIHDNIIKISDNSRLLWIICEIGKSLQEQAHYSIHIPNYAEGYDLFFFNRDFDSINFYFIKKAKQIGNKFTPGIS